MSKTVTFKLLNGIDIIGKLNEEESAKAEYAHIPNAIILDDALVISIKVIRGENDEARAQVSFEPVTIPVEGQMASRVAISPSSINYQYTPDNAYVDGYHKSLSPIVLPPGGGGKIIA